MRKKSLLSLALSTLTSFAIASSVHAINVKNNMDDLKTNVGFGDNNPIEILTSLVALVLGFLGLIAVIIILIAGFLWMTAGGNDDRVKKAKTMMVQGLIGLIIVLSAYGISGYVLDTLIGVTGA